MLVAIAKPAARAALAKARACGSSSLRNHHRVCARAAAAHGRTRARARGARGLALPKPPDPRRALALPKPPDPRRVLVVRKTRDPRRACACFQNRRIREQFFFKCELLPGGERRAWTPKVHR